MNIAELGQNQILSSRNTVGMILGLPITRPWLKYVQRMVEGKAVASSDGHISEPPIFAAGHALVELVKPGRPTISRRRKSYA